MILLRIEIVHGNFSVLEGKQSQRPLLHGDTPIRKCLIAVLCLGRCKCKLLPADVIADIRSDSEERPDQTGTMILMRDRHNCIFRLSYKTLFDDFQQGTVQRISCILFRNRQLAPAFKQASYLNGFLFRLSYRCLAKYRKASLHPLDADTCDGRFIDRDDHKIGLHRNAFLNRDCGMDGVLLAESFSFLFRTAQQCTELKMLRQRFRYTHIVEGTPSGTDDDKLEFFVACNFHIHLSRSLNVSCSNLRKQTPLLLLLRNHFPIFLLSRFSYSSSNTRSASLPISGISTIRCSQEDR